MQEMHTLRQDMFDELASKSPGERKLENIAQKMGETHRDLKINSMQFFAEVNKLCTEDQRQQLNKLFQELKNMPENRGYERPGRRHRRGHQWRNQQAPR